MQRRNFLIGAAGASMGAACSPLAGGVDAGVAPTPRSDWTGAGVDDFLRRVHDGRRAIAGSTPLTDLLVHHGRDPSKLPPAALARDEDLFKKSLDSLFLVGSFRDLPENEQLDPRVQDLMWGSMDDMNDAVLGVADHLERLPEERRRAIGDKLRKQPDLAVGMFEAIDSHAAKMGIASHRRLQLRNIAMQAGWRLRAQPVSLLIDEHVAKVRTIAARQNQRLLEEIAYAPAPSGSGPRQRSSATVATVGAILLGCSVGVGLLGGALIAAGSGSGGAATGVGLVMVTVGVIGAIGGLVTLLVGAIMAAAGK